MPTGVIATLGEIIVMVCGDTAVGTRLADFSEKRMPDLPSMRRVGLSSGSMKR